MPAATVDRQRSSVYAAEDLVARHLEHAAAGARTVEAAGSVLVLPLELRFGSLPAVQDYADRVLAASWFADRFPAAAATPVHVRRRRGDRAAHYEAPGVIAVHEPRLGSGWALRELVVLHELAHHAVAHDVAPGGGVPAHGAAYAGVLHRVVAEALGPEAALLLAVTFTDLGVGWTPRP